MSRVVATIIFLFGVFVGGVLMYGWVSNTWTSPRHTKNMHVEMQELRKVIDGRCRQGQINLNDCLKERDDLRDAVKEKCNNVIKYAVMLEIENNWLNKVISHCKCDRNSVPRD